MSGELLQEIRFICFNPFNQRFYFLFKIYLDGSERRIPDATNFYKTIQIATS